VKNVKARSKTTQRRDPLNTGFRRELQTVVDNFGPESIFLDASSLGATHRHQPFDSHPAVIGSVVALKLFSLCSQVIHRRAAESRFVFRLSVYRVMIRVNALVIAADERRVFGRLADCVFWLLSR
jgi:hypothetical protein